MTGYGAAVMSHDGSNLTEAKRLAEVPILIDILADKIPTMIAFILLVVAVKRWFSTVTSDTTRNGRNRLSGDSDFWYTVVIPVLLLTLARMMP